MATSESAGDNSRDEQVCLALWKVLFAQCKRHSGKQAPGENESENGRIHTRRAVGIPCEYRLPDMPNYRQAMLHDISASGMAISVYRKLNTEQAVTLLVETGDPKKIPLIVHASVVREIDITDDGLRRYGCRIDRVIDPNK